MVPDKGTVIEVGRGRAVIMTDRCEFVEIKTSGSLLPGDEIEYSPADLVRPRRFSWTVLALAASLIICCLAGFYAFQQMLAGKVYAYVALEINPGLEMAIDKEYRIIELNGTNGDGHKLVQVISLPNMELGDSLKAVVNYSQASGFLSKENTNYIAVALCVPGESGRGELMEKTNASLKNELEIIGASARIFYLNIDKDTRDRAIRENTSPIRYLIRLEAGKQGQTIGLEEISLKNGMIRNILDQVAVRIEVLPGPLDEPGAAFGGAGIPLPEADRSLPRSQVEKPPVDSIRRQKDNTAGQEDRHNGSVANQTSGLFQPTVIPDEEAGSTQKNQSEPPTKQGGSEFDSAKPGPTVGKSVVTPGKDGAGGGGENGRSGGGSGGSQNAGGSGSGQSTGGSGSGNQSSPGTGGGSSGGASGGGQGTGVTGGGSTGSGYSSGSGSSVDGSGGRR